MGPYYFCLYYYYYYYYYYYVCMSFSFKYLLVLYYINSIASSVHLMNVSIPFPPFLPPAFPPIDRIGLTLHVTTVVARSYVCCIPLIRSHWLWSSYHCSVWATNPPPLQRTLIVHQAALTIIIIISNTIIISIIIRLGKVHQTRHGWRYLKRTSKSTC